MLQRIIQCCTLNGGIFCLSIVIFEYIILPALGSIMSLTFGNFNEDIWLWTRSLLSWTFGAVWVLPIFMLTKIINSLWFQVIYSFNLMILCPTNMLVMIYLGYRRHSL